MASRARVDFTIGKWRFRFEIKLFSKENEALVKEIDKDVKNKFRWSWLEISVTVRVKIGKNTEDVIEEVIEEQQNSLSLEVLRYHADGTWKNFEEGD